jgi:hypothetical protein
MFHAETQAAGGLALCLELSFFFSVLSIYTPVSILADFAWLYRQCRYGSDSESIWGSSIDYVASRLSLPLIFSPGRTAHICAETSHLLTPPLPQTPSNWPVIYYLVDNFLVHSVTCRYGA